MMEAETRMDSVFLGQSRDSSAEIKVAQLDPTPATNGGIMYRIQQASFHHENKLHRPLFSVCVPLLD
jgi:hypothetical protein